MEFTATSWQQRYSEDTKTEGLDHTVPRLTKFVQNKAFSHGNICFSNFRTKNKALEPSLRIPQIFSDQPNIGSSQGMSEPFL